VTLDTNGEEIPPGSEAPCSVCKALDWRDELRLCSQCEGLAHEDCMSRACDFHRICQTCADASKEDEDGDAVCPVCEEAREYDEDVAESWRNR
jgi:hypothetical protein